MVGGGGGSVVGAAVVGGGGLGVVYSSTMELQLNNKNRITSIKRFTYQRLAPQVVVVVELLAQVWGLEWLAQV